MELHELEDRAEDVVLDLHVYIKMYGRIGGQSFWTRSLELKDVLGRVEGSEYSGNRNLRCAIISSD